MTLLFLLVACEPERACNSDLTEDEYIRTSFANSERAYECVVDLDTGYVGRVVANEYECWDHVGFHPCRAEGALGHQAEAVAACDWDREVYYYTAPNGEPVWDEVRWMCM